MVANTLTDHLINGGKILLETLDSSGLKVDGAFWFYFPEEGYWKLLISIPEVEKEGPRAAYKAIQKTMSKIDADKNISLDDVTIAKPHASLLKSLRKVVHTDRGIGSMRFTNNVINGQLIPDAYIYRLLK